MIKSNQHLKLARKTINIHWLFTNSSDSFRFRGVGLGGSGQTNLVTLPISGIFKSWTTFFGKIGTYIYKPWNTTPPPRKITRILPCLVLTLMTWLIFFSDSESLFVNSEATLWTSSVSVSLNSSSWWIWLYYSQTKRNYCYDTLWWRVLKNPSKS